MLTAAVPGGYGGGDGDGGGKRGGNGGGAGQVETGPLTPAGSRVIAQEQTVPP